MSGLQGVVVVVIEGAVVVRPNLRRYGLFIVHETKFNVNVTIWCARKLGRNFGADGVE